MIVSVKQVARRVARRTMSFSGVSESIRQLSLRGYVPKAVWQRLPVEGRFAVTNHRRPAFSYVSHADDVIGRSLYWRGLSGAWETETIPIFSLLAGTSSVFLDIGANTGTYSLMGCFLNTNLHAYAFEPVPRTSKALLNNVIVNGYQDRISVVEAAVADQCGLTNMHVPLESLPTSASLSHEGFRGLDGELIEVRVLSIDSMQPSLGKVDLCKIDVEGFEDVVLTGMERTIYEFRPSIIVECNPDGPYRTVSRKLSDAGYRLFSLPAEGPYRVDSIVPEAGARSFNFLAVAREEHIRAVERHSEGQRPF